jgi:ADP-ribosylglycohydrolase
MRTGGNRLRGYGPRNAISIGGDSDTIACITGGIAEVMFGMPNEIVDPARNYLTDDLIDALDRFDLLRVRPEGL